MASAGDDETARAEAVKGRERIESEADAVLSRIGSGPEADVARSGSVRP